jgi:hypothetical protein
MSTTQQLEQQVMQAVTNGLAEAIMKKFEGYNSPLDALLKDVLTRRSTELSTLMDNAITAAIRTDDFKTSLADAFDKKLSKVLLAGFEGEIERRANKLREDPAFRAKITVAIDAAVKSCTP